MKKKRIAYSILCALGGVAIGVCANRLNTGFGGAMFIIGLAVMVYSMIQMNK